MPFLAAALIGIVLIALAGVALHYLVIRPVLDSAPINQLLVTGGVLFVLQAAATMVFGIDFKNLGIRLGSFNAFDMSFSYARIVTFGVALAAMLLLWLFLSRTYIGIAIRAIAQDRAIMPLMGVDQRQIYLVTSAIGGGLAGLAASLMVLQYDIYPQIGLQFGPLIFMICVLGGLGSMIGGFVAAFIISEFIAVGSLVLRDRMGLRHRVPVLHGGDLHPAAGPVRGQIVMRLSRTFVVGLAAMVLLPLAVRFVFPAAEKYYLHLLIQILIWSFIYTGWSLMGRFGLTSLGHGAFTGIGAYVMVLLWNFAGITPWIGIPVAVVVSIVVALLVGYPCFHLRIVGHYFALLTLALTEFVRLCIVGLREFTGGSLGTQPARYGDGISLYALQFEPDRVLSYYVALRSG